MGRTWPTRFGTSTIRPELERLPQLVLLPRGRSPHLGQVRDRHQHRPTKLLLPGPRGANLNDAVPLLRRSPIRPLYGPSADEPFA